GARPLRFRGPQRRPRATPARAPELTCEQSVDSLFPNTDQIPGAKRDIGLTRAVPVSARRGASSRAAQGSATLVQLKGPKALSPFGAFTPGVMVRRRYSRWSGSVVPPLTTMRWKFGTS